MSEKESRATVYRRAHPYPGYSRPVCERCGRGNLPLTIHHRIHRSVGGTWDVSNLVLLCGSGTGEGCHPWVESNPEAAEAEGYWVKPWEETARVSLLKYGRYRVFFKDDGTIERCPTPKDFRNDEEVHGVREGGPPA